jgi:hypothetical protein
MLEELGEKGKGMGRGTGNCKSTAVNTLPPFANSLLRCEKSVKVSSLFYFQGGKFLKIYLLTGTFN